MAGSEEQAQHRRTDPRICLSDSLWVPTWFLEDRSPASKTAGIAPPQSVPDQLEQPSGHIDSFSDIDEVALNPSGYEAQIFAHYDRANPEQARRPIIRDMDSLRSAVLTIRTATSTSPSLENPYSSGEPDAFFVGNPWSQRWSNGGVPPAMAVYDSAVRSARYAESGGANDTHALVSNAGETSGAVLEAAETRARDMTTGRLTMTAEHRPRPTSSVSAFHASDTQSVQQEDFRPAVELPTNTLANISDRQSSAARPYLGPCNGGNLERPWMAEIVRQAQEREPGNRTTQIQQFEEILQGLLRISERQEELVREERWLMETLANIVQAEISAQIAEVQEEQRHMEEAP